MANIRIFVANPQNLNDVEDQIYSNNTGIPLEAVRKIFGNRCVVTPEIGNFPHVGGNSKPVIIANISVTTDADNAGLDVADLIQKYCDWGRSGEKT